MNNLKIKSKLILLFILIKVIPLLLLSYIAIEGAKELNNYFEQTTKNTFEKSKDIIANTANTAVSDSIKALDKKSQSTLERLSFEVANDIASFLYERDKDLLVLANFAKLNDESLEKFLNIKTSRVAVHGEYEYNNSTKKWELINNIKENKPIDKANLLANDKEFNINAPVNIVYKSIPLYKEIQVIDLNGQELYKVSSLNKNKIDIKVKENTYCKAENYFDKLKDLKKGDIYVSEVIGEYVNSGLIGTFTKEKAKKMNIEFAPKNHGYAGKENPLGKRFEGIVRFATPIYENGKKVAYVSFALDHRHIMEFSDNLDPLTQNNKQDIADASSGNYAFMWDFKGRNISHARDYFIMGYDSNTGEKVPGWLSVDIANKFKSSKEKNLNKFLEQYPQFEEQSLKKKPNIAQLKNAGEVGLDCRYLNFAPQCEGWMQLTQEGGYGSFVIFWSGVWKLTTAATIPYYTGQYANTKRGFGFVTIGANVDEFHLAANKTKKNVNEILATQTENMKQELDENKHNVLDYIHQLRTELVVVTFLMIIIIIAVAIWMSNLVTNKISNLLQGIKEYSKQNFDFRIAVSSKDEIGELEYSFNDMADEIKKLIERQKNTNVLLDMKVHEANAASKAKSDFLASMSHEIRTPLNAIFGFVEILKAKEKDEKKLEYFRIVQNAGDDLLKIINDILDFSKIELNKVELEYIRVNPQEGFLNIVKQFQMIAEKKNIELEYLISEELSQYINVDFLKITQVLNNLLSNAIKFTPDNGKVRLEIKYNNTKDELLVCVEDNGIGIEKEKQNIIFEPFTQADNTTTRKYGGTGLGLSISSKLVELMGGELKLDKRKSDGARFYLNIKIHEDTKIEELNQKNENISKESNKKVQELIHKIKILIVEDNKSNQVFMKVLMKKLSVEYEIANNGQEAVELYKKGGFDLILMDENMPIMSGSEATIQIREIEKLTENHIIIVALTANALIGDKERFEKVGMDDYISKPFKKVNLDRIMEKYFIKS